jgi:hypothetical protein
MLPDNFDFAMLPVDKDTATLKEIGMLASTIENIDYAITSWLKEDLIISTTTNEGFIKVPVLWQVPERAYQVKFKEDLRDDGDALKLPIISIERTGITKDPARKGAFQAHLYSDKKNGRSGRMVIAKKIVQDKTRNFAAASGTRGDQSGAKKQLYYPRINKKVVIKSLSIPIPVYVNLDYKVTLKCEYQQQMNTMLAPFIGRTGQINAFTMTRNGHLYEGFIDQSFGHSNNVNDLGEDMRMYTSEITIKVLGYLIGEGESDDRPLVQIHENVVEISFPSEEAVPEGNDSLFL